LGQLHDITNGTKEKKIPVGTADERVNSIMSGAGYRKRAFPKKITKPGETQEEARRARIGKPKVGCDSGVRKKKRRIGSSGARETHLTLREIPADVLRYYP